MPAAWAGVASAAVGAIGSAVAAGGKSDAIKGGQDAANALSEKTIQEARDNYARDRSTYQPFVDQGTTGLKSYADALGVNGADASAAARDAFTASPGYGYQLEQGLRAVDAGAASKGLLRSGATMKAEQTFGSNLANTDFSNYLGRLNTLAQYGLQGAQGQAQSTQTFNALLNGQSAGQQQTITDAAGKQASIYGSEISGITNAIGGGLSSAKENGLFSSGSSVGTTFSGPGLGA